MEYIELRLYNNGYKKMKVSITIIYIYYIMLNIINKSDILSVLLFG